MLRLFSIVLILSLGYAQEVAPRTITNTVAEAPTVDTKRKIIVQGSNSAIRSRILGIAVDQRDQLYSLLNLDKDAQKLPLNITLYGAEGDKAPPLTFKKSFNIIQGRINLTLAVHLARGIDESLLEQTILELLLYELGLQEHTFQPTDTLEVSLKPWLLNGVKEALNWNNDRSDRALYASIFEQQSIYPLDALLEEDNLEGNIELIVTAFQVSSGALVMALSNQPQGKAGLASMIKQAATYEGEQRNLLTQHFPESTLSKNSLAKWWALQLASMSQNPAEELFTIKMTEESIDEALLVEITDFDGNTHELSPERYHELLNFDKNSQKASAAKTYNTLSVLQSRAFPSYRSLIAGYQQVLFAIIEESSPAKKSFWAYFKRKKEAEPLDTHQMLQTLSEERAIIAKLGERTTDYLNWYQLEQPEGQGKNFENFLRVQESLNTPPPSDNSHISKYLDDIQKIYER